MSFMVGGNTQACCIVNFSWDLSSYYKIIVLSPSPYPTEIQMISLKLLYTALGSVLNTVIVFCSDL